jgi:hypothetical protein
MVMISGEGRAKWKGVQNIDKMWGCIVLSDESENMATNY